jgi:6-pyruvoyltetrahydropterin/6-carboxytetrahydropterin synthase
MQMKVGRHFEFEASHKLPDEEIYGQCRNLHGHRYELDIEVIGEVGKEGWVCNFSELKGIVQHCILDKYDHAYLNYYFEIPTAENMVIYMDEVLSKEFADKNYKVSRIRLHETSKCYAEIEK